jgi:isoprenylcysteine carboxyl methyltransferase (ICMT) family protein YpbQ
MTMMRPISAAESTSASAPRAATLATPRPASAVSTGVGFAGLFGLIAWLLFSRYVPDIAAFVSIDWGDRGVLSGPNSALASVLACALPMVGWSVLVDKVHRNASTGIDWALRRPWRETIDISLVKLTGLWATWGLLALAYGALRYYWDGQYIFSMQLLATLAPWLIVASVPYILWLDRRMIDPRDGCHAFGAWLIGRGQEGDRRAIAHHLRAWAVKGFFTAFMLSIVPGNFAVLVERPWAVITANPVEFCAAAVLFLYLVDVHVATVGYVLTLKPLDAHIRTANPYGMAWVAALICYPPFILMSGGPLDYQVNGAEWDYWFADYPLLLMIWGGMAVFFTAVYSWATLAFGIRFSNLTHRGIITHGPYRITRHPAYVSKNISWWILSMPFLVTAGGWVEAVRNCVLLLIVNLIYYWRAKTEEKHLLADPAYRAYWDWAQANALVPRLCARLSGRRRPLVVLDPDERVGPVA